MAIYNFYRGTTFFAEVTYVPEAGWPATLEGVDIYSDFLDSRNQRYKLTIEKNVDNLHFTCRFDTTQDWYPGTAYWDILFINNDVAFYSGQSVWRIQPNVTPNDSSTVPA